MHIEPLFTDIEYVVFCDTEDAEYDEPLFEGTFRECDEFIKQNPHTMLRWWDDDAGRAPTLELQ